MKHLSVFLTFLILASAGRLSAQVTSPDQHRPQEGEQGWVQANIPTGAFVGMLSPASERVIYASTAAGVFRSTDYGVNWSPFSTPFQGALHMIDQERGYLAALGSNDVVYYTSNTGETWDSARTGHPLTFSMAIVTPDTAFTFGSSYVSRTTDHGQTWESKFIDATGLKAMAFRDSKLGIAVGDHQMGPTIDQEGAGCFRTTDGGETWNQIYVGGKSGLKGIDWVDANTVVAAGGTGLIYRSSNAGLTWDSIRTPSSTEALLDISMRGEQGLITGSRGLVLRTDDGGKTWHRETTSVNIYLHGALYLSDTLAFACGDNGTLLRRSGLSDVTRAAAKHQSLVRVHSNGSVVSFTYELANAQTTTARIHSIDGKLVTTLLKGVHQAAGSQALQWNVGNEPRGSYLLTIRGEHFASSLILNVIR